MQFTLPLVALAGLAIRVLADTETISLLVLRSGSKYHYSGITEKNSTFIVGGTSDYVEGVITNAGLFKLSDGKYAKVNSDGTITADTEGSSPFGIQDGYFTYKGSESFGVDSVGGDLFFDKGNTPIALMATTSSGRASDFTPSNSSSSSSSSSSAPISSVTDIHNRSTIVTITSCEKEVCTQVPITTGVTVVTTTSDNVVTEYTTYCPLTTEVTSANNFTSPTVTTYEAAAAKAVPAVAAIAAGVAFLF